MRAQYNSSSGAVINITDYIIARSFFITDIDFELDI